VGVGCGPGLLRNAGIGSPGVDIRSGKTPARAEEVIDTICCSALVANWHQTDSLANFAQARC
jgi:hypothetical protein